MNAIFTLSLHTGFTYYFTKCQLPDISKVPSFNSRAKSIVQYFSSSQNWCLTDFLFTNLFIFLFQWKRKLSSLSLVLSTPKPLQQPASSGISLIHKHFQRQILFSVIHRHTYNCFRKQTRSSEVVLQNYSSLLYIFKKIGISLKYIYEAVLAQLYKTT